MPDTNTHPELPPPACIVTNMGDDKPQSFMLATVHGVALAMRPVGSTISLFTAEQVRAAILADRSRLQVDQDARDAKRYQQFLRTSNEEFDRMRRLAQMHSGYGGKSISESLDEAISRAAMDAVKEPR